MLKQCFTLLFATLILSGCSAEWHLTRAIKKNPSILQSRTMTVTDTVVTDPTVVRDTVTISQRDTVEIIKDKFRVKIMRSYDTLIIDGGCDADTIVRTVSVSVPQLVVGESRLQRVQRYTFWGLISLLLISIAILVIRKSLKIN
jgi:PBP1b-binding outer membrane lipoprotein LpoB